MVDEAKREGRAVTVTGTMPVLLWGEGSRPVGVAWQTCAREDVESRFRNRGASLSNAGSRHAGPWGGQVLRRRRGESMEGGGGCGALAGALPVPSAVY